MLSLVLSLLVLLAILLVAGAFLLWRKGAPALQVILVLVVAGIVLINIAIWTVPNKDGTSPAEQAQAMGSESGGKSE